MLPRIVSRLALTLAVGLAAPLSSAAANPGADAAATGGLRTPEQLIARMEATQSDLRSLSADFVQTSRVKLFKQELRSEGRLLYLRASDAPPSQPNRLRWEYLRPDPSTLVMVGSQARLRMGNLPPQNFDTGRDSNLRAIFAQLRLWLGAGTLAEAQAEYELRSGGSATQPVLILVPRPTSTLAKAFSRVELQLDGRSFQVARLLLIEQSGDEKEIVFSHLQRNQPLPLKLFDLP